mmetsp:Transcript_151487/g.486186  ORF Transcript_151487/g.486186 Transcript_151487/m.486186 type:complete len:316 (-) Transcript_151487:213-1160(-)
MPSGGSWTNEMASLYLSKPHNLCVTMLCTAPPDNISTAAFQSSGSDDKEPRTCSCLSTMSSARTSDSLLPERPSSTTRPPGATTCKDKDTAEGVPAASIAIEGKSAPPWLKKATKSSAVPRSAMFHTLVAPNSRARSSLAGFAPTMQETSHPRHFSTCNTSKPTGPSPTTTTLGRCSTSPSSPSKAKRTALCAHESGSDKAANSHGTCSGSVCNCAAGKRSNVCNAPDRRKNPVSARRRQRKKPPRAEHTPHVLRPPLGAPLAATTAAKSEQPVACSPTTRWPTARRGGQPPPKATISPDHSCPGVCGQEAKPAE